MSRTISTIASWKWPIGYALLMVLIAAGATLWESRSPVGTCEMDGQPIDPHYEVDLKLADGSWHSFCSILCARRWLDKKKIDYPEEARVRDALTGVPLDAYVAFFVESPIVTNPANGNNIHAFRYRTDAADHIRRFGGHMIDSPF